MAYELFDFSSDKVRNPSFISCKPVNRSTIIKYDSLNSLLFLSRPSKKYKADPSLRFSVPRFNACSCATDSPRTCSTTISTACYTTAHVACDSPTYALQLRRTAKHHCPQLGCEPCSRFFVNYFSKSLGLARNYGVGTWNRWNISI